jgi:DDE superfamily endonuclease
VSDRARLDVSAPVLKAVTGWLAGHRRRPGTRPGQRAATVHTQVTLLLRWLRHRLDLRTLALQARVSIATGYRYLHAGLDVIAAHAPDLTQVLADARRAGVVFLCLDGTLIPTDRVAARVEVDGHRAHHLGFSGKHRAFGGNVQVLTDHTGFPLWVSAVRPGSTVDLTAARELVLPTLYRQAVRGLPVLADKGYTGAGIGVLAPYKNRPEGPLHLNNRCYNELITALRAPTARAATWAMVCPARRSTAAGMSCARRRPAAAPARRCGRPAPRSAPAAGR